MTHPTLSDPRAHALGVSLQETPEQAMQRLSNYKEDELREEIAMWKSHAADLSQAIRRNRKAGKKVIAGYKARVDRLYLVIFATGLLAAYALMMTPGCAATESGHITIGALR